MENAKTRKDFRNDPEAVFDQGWHCLLQEFGRMRGSDLKVLLTERLTVREADSEAPDYRDNIEQLRARIDLLDENLLEILKSRMSVSEEIGHFKKEHNIVILQTRRWDELLDDMIRKGDAEGLNEQFLRNLFGAIHEESIRVQNDILMK